MAKKRTKKKRTKKYQGPSADTGVTVHKVVVKDKPKWREFIDRHRLGLAASGFVVGIILVIWGVISAIF